MSYRRKQSKGSIEWKFKPEAKNMIGTAVLRHGQEVWEERLWYSFEDRNSLRSLYVCGQNGKAGGNENVTITVKQHSPIVRRSVCSKLIWYLRGCKGHDIVGEVAKSLIICDLIPLSNLLVDCQIVCLFVVVGPPVCWLIYRWIFVLKMVSISFSPYPSFAFSCPTTKYTEMLNS